MEGAFDTINDNDAATIAMWLGGLMVAAIAITWILKLVGVL